MFLIYAVWHKSCLFFFSLIFYISFFFLFCLDIIIFFLFIPSTISIFRVYKFICIPILYFIDVILYFNDFFLIVLMSGTKSCNCVFWFIFFYFLSVSAVQFSPGLKTRVVLWFFYRPSRCKE